MNVIVALPDKIPIQVNIKKRGYFFWSSLFVEQLKVLF
jgi:hypothetical protein